MSISFGQKLVQFRLLMDIAGRGPAGYRYQGLSQVRLAEMIGVDHSLISRLQVLAIGRTIGTLPIFGSGPVIE